MTENDDRSDEELIEQVEQSLAEDWRRIEEASVEQTGMTLEEREAQFEEGLRQHNREWMEEHNIDVGLTIQGRLAARADEDTDDKPVADDGEEGD